VVAGGAVFKGGRFVGVFKHIPHMVTCATVAFVFSGNFIISSGTKAFDVCIFFSCVHNY
jgi:uncharacterized protein (DUF2062 family)